MSSPAAGNGDAGAGSDFIPLGDDCFLVAENRCGVRFLGARPARLDFDAAADEPAPQGRVAKRRHAGGLAGRPAGDSAASAGASG